MPHHPRALPGLVRSLVAVGLSLVILYAGWATAQPPWDWETYQELPVVFEAASSEGSVTRLGLTGTGAMYAVEIRAPSLSADAAMAMFEYDASGALVAILAGTQADGSPRVELRAGVARMDTWLREEGGSSDWLMVTIVDGASAVGAREFVSIAAGRVGEHTVRVYSNDAVVTRSAVGNGTLFARSADFAEGASVAVVYGDRSARAQIAVARDFQVEHTLTGYFASGERAPDNPGLNHMTATTPAGVRQCGSGCSFDRDGAGAYRFEITGAGAHTWRGSDVVLLLADVPPLE